MMQKLRICVSILLSIILSLTSFAGAFAADITLYANGNPAGNTYTDGILTAKSTADGLFAIAVYKDGELVRLSLTEDRDSVSMATSAPNGETIKIFRMGDGLTPLCVSKSPAYAEPKNRMIFANENFDNGSLYTVDGVTNILEDGRLKIVGNSETAAWFTKPVQVRDADRYLVAEADFALSSAYDDGEINLINFYNPYVKPLVKIKKVTTSYLGGRYTTESIVISAHDGSAIKEYKQSAYSDLYGGINVAAKLDLQNMTYDVYIDGVKCGTTESYSAIFGGEPAYTFPLPIAHMKKDTTEIVYVDNVKVYCVGENEGPNVDISGSIPNVHWNSHSSQRPNTTIYARPAFKEIASLTGQKDHPRILVNRAKLDDIRDSDNSYISSWREAVLAEAKALIGTPVCTYRTEDVNGISNDDVCLDRIMKLGIAYNLTGLRAYADRALEEIEALEAVFPNWGDRKALSVGELSAAYAILYDWMYDALTTAEKNKLIDTVMRNSIYPSYKTYHNQDNGSLKVDTNTWYKSTNNWNPVCNGGAIIASLAFMEADMYTCSVLAEAALRGLEAVMPVFAPGGAWIEGAMYWGYAMKYLTFAMAAIESCCGSTYGIEAAEGFDKTSLFGLSVEGKTGVLNFSDSATVHLDAPFMFYWSRIYQNKTFTAAALYAKEAYDTPISAFDLVYFDPDMYDSAYKAPLGYHFDETETVSLTSGYGSTNSLVAMSGGLGTNDKTGHDHLDSGGVIVEMRGKRVFRDIGAEHYEATGYFADQRYNYFRARPEGHNIFIIDPMNTTDDSEPYYGQRRTAYSDVTYFSEAEKRATMDLSAAYGRDADSASRTIALDGENVVITDSIKLKGTKDVYWNWYVKTRNNGSQIGSIELINNNKSARITLEGEIFEVSFGQNSDYTLEVQEAVQYTPTQPATDKFHANTDYQRLVVKLEGASGTIDLVTTVK